VSEAPGAANGGFQIVDLTTNRSDAFVVNNLWATAFATGVNIGGMSQTGWLERTVISYGDLYQSRHGNSPHAYGKNAVASYTAQHVIAYYLGDTNALQSLGLSHAAIPWLIDGDLAFFAIVVAEVWSSTPVFAILILAGLLAMPKEPIEAAKVDGCTPWQSFRYVTWPFIMPFAYIAMTIRSLDVGRAYDIVKIMTDGGPARRTELLWTLIARTAYSDARMGAANAMAYASITLSILFTVYFFRKLATARTQIAAEW